MKIRRKLDEYGMVISDELDFKFYGGGGKGGGGGKTEKIYMPAPAALSTPVATPVTPAPAPVSEAVTQDTAATPEEEAKKLKEANKAGAKSLQIPLTGSTSAVSDAAKSVGTV
jgi:hypothetical protein